MITAIDIFGGAGGSSTGMYEAGIRVGWAGNHDDNAVAVHEANHPTTVHVKRDLIEKMDWSQVPPHDLLWASPSCQGHSNGASRGGTGRRASAPKHDSDRATAWAVVDAVETCRPRCLAIENVTQFRNWSLYGIWKDALELLGYGLQEIVLSPSQLGGHQERPRLFIVGTLGHLPKLPDLPNQTPGPMRDLLDLDQGVWRDPETLSHGQRARVLAACARHAREDAVMVQNVTGHPGRTLDRPFPVVTTKHQMGVAKRDGSGWVYRALRGIEYSRAMDFPEDYDWIGLGVSEVARLAGNAVSPRAARWIAEAALAA